MVLLLGLSANASGLRIECPGATQGGDASQPQAAVVLTRRFNDATEPTQCAVKPRRG